MQGELNKNVVKRGKGERGSPPSPPTSFFLTQPSNPDVYGLYKLLRARECPPLWSSSAEAQTYHFLFSLLLSVFAASL